MFTGIIEDIGTIHDIKKMAGRWEIFVKTALDESTIKIGDSISVDGVCLTAITISRGVFSADASLETLKLTTFKDKRTGDKVNLERAMSAEGRFGGHIVTGHVDGIGAISDIKKEGDSVQFTIQVPADCARYIVKKGSVTIDGISLTVNEQSDNTFTVNIIPHTASLTTLGHKKLRDTLNIETDIIGKYVEHFLTKDKGGGIDKEFLYRYGFIKGE